MTQIKLSVVMPVYDGEAYIRSALQSLLDQTETHFEVIVVDDGSQDATAAIVSDFSNGGWPRVRLIRQDNTGVSAARNVGIRTAIAPLIGFLDADDVWSPMKVARHLALMNACPDIEVSFSSFDHIDSVGAPLIDQSIVKEGRYDHDDLMPRNFIHTSTVIARRDALLEVGGFDESLQTFEDFDLWLRIAQRRDQNIYAIADVLAKYRRHETQTTGQWLKMHEGWKAVAERLAREHPNAWRKVEKSAWAHQYEYTASLAYNAGDTQQMRSLMWKAWCAGRFELLKNANSTIMLGVALASYVPRPAQIAIGWTFNQLRLIKRWVGVRVVSERNKEEY